MIDQKAIEDCIKLCWECRHQCQKNLYTYCLQEGGAHIEPEHVKIMTDCIQICQAAADFMTRDSTLHAAACMACMEVCEACAKSCRKIDMGECADSCQACANSCRNMADRGERKAA